MRPVTDDFLLNMAEVSATLIGLFLVGVFFFVEGVLQRGDQRISQPYLRAGTRITLIVMAIPLGLSLTLVALTPAWSRALFVVLSVALIAANADSLLRLRGVRSVALVANEVFTTALAVLIVVLPWALGGFEPTREDLTWSILLAFAAGLLSIAAIVMSAFDVARPVPAEPGEHALDEVQEAGTDGPITS